MKITVDDNDSSYIVGNGCGDGNITVTPEGVAALKSAQTFHCTAIINYFSFIGSKVTGCF